MRRLTAASAAIVATALLLAGPASSHFSRHGTKCGSISCTPGVSFASGHYGIDQVYARGGVGCPTARGVAKAVKTRAGMSYYHGVFTCGKHRRHGGHIDYSCLGHSKDLRRIYNIYFAVYGAS